jgi:hypothetical protein
VRRRSPPPKFTFNRHASNVGVRVADGSPGDGELRLVIGSQTFINKGWQ